MTTHTILFVQMGEGPETRTYLAYDTLQEAMEGILRMYEKKLKGENPSATEFTYDVGQLFEFIQQLPDMSCVVLRKTTGTYHPFNREWIKEKVYVYCKRLAKKTPTGKEKEIEKDSKSESVEASVTKD